MLVADPSSSCDVCYSAFGPDTECHCIPCGHVFCHPCILRLPRPICPLCRTRLSSRNRDARKIIVDWSPRPSQNGQPLRVVYEKELEKQLAEEAERGITLKRALQLQQKIQDFVKHQPAEEHIVLKAFASALCALYESKDQLADMKKHFEQLAQSERNLQREHRLAIESNRRNGSIIRHLLDDVKGFERTINLLRDRDQKSFDPSISSVRSQSLRENQRLGYETREEGPLQDLPSVGSHLPTPPDHLRFLHSSPDQPASSVSGSPSTPRTQTYPTAPVLPNYPALFPHTNRKGRGQVRFTDSSKLAPEPHDMHNDQDRPSIDRINDNIFHSSGNTMPQPSAMLPPPDNDRAPSNINTVTETNPLPKTFPAPNTYYPISHSMPRTATALLNLGGFPSTLTAPRRPIVPQTSLEVGYPPPPPMPTVHVPEIGVDDVWPYVATPRLRELMRKNMEERSARARAPPHPSLSYETVYWEQMRARVASGVPLPGHTQPPPAFYENRAGNTHNLHSWAHV